MEQSGSLPEHFRRFSREALVVLAGCGLFLYGVSAWNFLVFHTVAELFSVMVAFGAFTVAWHARKVLGGVCLILGVAALFIGIVDLFHALAYRGMHLFPGNDPNPPTQLWILGRMLEGAALVWVVARPQTPRGAVAPFAAFALATLAGMASILVWKVFPDCFVEGRGLTPFKIATEYLVMAIYAAAMALLLRRRSLFDPPVLAALTLSVGLRGVAEGFFTIYTDVYGLSSFLGHLVKIAAVWLAYRAVVVRGVEQPQSLLFTARASERRLADELRHQADTMTGLLQALPDQVLVLDRDLCCRYANPAAAELAGVPVGRLVGRLWFTADLPGDLGRHIEAATRRVLDRGEPTGFEIGRDDDLQDWRLWPIAGEDGRVAEVVAVGRRIGERARLEAELRRAVDEARAASQAKTRFLAAASHDLRQPMQALRLFLDILAVRLERPENRTVLKSALEAMEAGEDLLASLLDLSRLQAGMVQVAKARVSLAGVLDRLAVECGPQASSKGVALRLMPCSSEIETDPVLLLRMLRNLTLNAIRYTPPGGRVLVGCRRGSDGPRVEVHDTGPGIPESERELIFEEFYQIGNRHRDRKEGLGLGLSIVRRTGELLGHAIHLRSIEGRGSVFAVLLAGEPAGEAA